MVSIYYTPKNQTHNLILAFKKLPLGYPHKGTIPMYINQYADLNKALEKLKEMGDLRPSTPTYGPSLDEQTAYKTIQSNLPLADVMFHKPSKKILLAPKVGMGATLQYPSDSYPYEIVKVVSSQTLEVRRMIATAVPGWKADFTPGGFCGHIHNLRDQQFTYTSDPTAKIERIRLNKHGQWKNGYCRFTVGHACYFVDMNG